MIHFEPRWIFSFKTVADANPGLGRVFAFWFIYKCRLLKNLLSQKGNTRIDDATLRNANLEPLCLGLCSPMRRIFKNRTRWSASLTDHVDGDDDDAYESLAKLCG
jgi:hypothetical protein